MEVIFVLLHFETVPVKQRDQWSEYGCQQLVMNASSFLALRPKYGTCSLMHTLSEMDAT